MCSSQPKHVTSPRVGSFALFSFRTQCIIFYSDVDVVSVSGCFDQSPAAGGCANNHRSQDIIPSARTILQEWHDRKLSHEQAIEDLYLSRDRGLLAGVNLVNVVKQREEEIELNKNRRDALRAVTSIDVQLSVA